MRWLIYLASLGLMLALVAVGGALYGFYKFGRDLPDYKYLATYQPPVVTRVHAADGRLLAEYARERRVFVPVKAMPRRVIKAFLAAEDKTFYSHFGLDLTGLRAGGGDQSVANGHRQAAGRRLDHHPTSGQEFSALQRGVDRPQSERSDLGVAH